MASSINGAPTRTVTTRTYIRETPDHTETVYVNVDEHGYIRMTANNLHDVLTHIGFTPTKENA